MEKSVVENIVNSIVRNTEYYKKHGMLPIEYLNSNVDILRVAVRTTVFYVYYMIIINIQGACYLRLKNYTDHGVVSSELERSFLDSVGVSDNVDGELLTSILDVLTNMGLIKKVGRYGKVGEIRYYITTPAIAYRLYYDYLKYTNTKEGRRKTIEDIFESVVMCEVLNITGSAWYYMLNRGAFGNKEIDIVCSLDNDKLVLIEAKSSDNLGKCKKRAVSLVSCGLDNVADKVIVLRKGFEEVRGVERCNIRTNVKTERGGKLVEEEILLAHFDKLKQVLNDIYVRNKSEEDDLFREDWDI